jgi:hypothetical protein
VYRNSLRARLVGGGRPAPAAMMYNPLEMTDLMPTADDDDDDVSLRRVSEVSGGGEVQVVGGYVSVEDDTSPSQDTAQLEPDDVEA